LIGLISDHIGVRFSFNIWLLLCGAAACAVPIFIIKLKQDETVEEILAANTNSSAYASLLTALIFGTVSL